MKLLNSLEIIILAILFFAFGVLLSQTKFKQDIPATISSKKNSYESKLSDWVYEKSSKISRKICSQIVTEVMKYDHPILLLSIMEVESEFSPTAISRANAIGIGQIRWSIWGSSLSKSGIAHNKRDLFDLSVSIRAMDFIVHTLLSENNNDPTKAIEKYLGGKDGQYVARISRNFMYLSLIKK